MLTSRKVKLLIGLVSSVTAAVALSVPLRAAELFEQVDGEALTALTDAQLQTVRGGYLDSMRNIDISVALATETKINGEVVSSNQLLDMQISNGKVYNSSASANLMSLVQLGQGNVVADGLDDAFITIIQNKLDNQQIQHRTYIDIQANVLEAVEAASLDSQVQQQLIDSLLN